MPAGRLAIRLPASSCWSNPMANMARAGSDKLSSWWNIAAAITMVFGFGVLILITVKAYENAPPIPATVPIRRRRPVHSDDVAAGQQVF
jgi:nitric oxide reductase subunit B